MTKFRQSLQTAAVLLAFAAISCAGRHPPAQTAGPAAPAPALGRWEQHFASRAAQFAEENAALAPGARPVVFLGDSITEAFPLATQFPGWPVLDRGVVADVIARPAGLPPTMGLLNRLDVSVTDARPCAVAILIGTNHMPHAGESVDWIAAAYETLLDRIAASCPDAVVVVHTIPPAGSARADHVAFNERVRAFNARVREAARARALILVDLYALLADEAGVLRSEFTGDGIHLTPRAYDLWAAALRPHLALLVAHHSAGVPPP